MDCAQAPRPGWMRFLKTSYDVSTDERGVHISWKFMNWAGYQREAKLVVSYSLPNASSSSYMTNPPSNGWLYTKIPLKPAYPVDVDGYCKRHGYAGTRNIDGTARGWVCTPGDAPLRSEEVCVDEYGVGYTSHLLTFPPGKPGDTICGDRNYDFREFNLPAFCAKLGFPAAMWSCSANAQSPTSFNPNQAAFNPDYVCQNLYGASYSLWQPGIVDRPGTERRVCASKR